MKSKTKCQKFRLKLHLQSEIEVYSFSKWTSSYVLNSRKMCFFGFNELKFSSQQRYFFQISSLSYI